MRSKYFNQIFEDWKVMSAVKTKGNHKSFILAKKTSYRTLLMTLRDSQLSNIANNKTTIDDIIAGKFYQLSKNIRKTQNTIAAL